MNTPGRPSDPGNGIPQMSSEIIFYIVFAVMTVAALAIVLPPMLRTHRPGEDEKRAADPEAVLARALSEERRRLDEEHERGDLDDVRHAELLEELKHRAVEEHRQLAEAAVETGETRLHPAWAACVVAFVVAVSFGIYSFVGAPEVNRLTADQRVLEGTAPLEAIETYLKDNEKDGRAWILLARRYIDRNDLEQAAVAYRNGRKHMKKVAEDPKVMLELAATLLQIGGDANYAEAYPLADEASRLMPGNLKATELLAMAAAATRHWIVAQSAMERLLENEDTSSPNYLQHFDTYRMVKALADEERRQKGIPVKGDAPAPAPAPAPAKQGR